MDTEQVSTRIEQLVDHLRASKDSQITLGDVAGVTEVLLATMRRYFNSLDISLYEEMRALSDHIKRARSEISELQPDDLKETRIPRAGKELEAIVQSTEEATGTIMDAAEEIMSADSSDIDAYKQTVDDACMRMFEACSFQDITGQRITKVVSTLTHIEERLSALQTAWGPDIQDAKRAGEPEVEQVVNRQDEVKAGLLNGPALAGEGIDQSAIDSLLSGEDAGEAPAAAKPAPEPEAEPEPEAAAEPEPEPAPEPAVEATPEPASEPASESAEAEPAEAPADKPEEKKKTPAKDTADEVEELAAAGEEVSQAEIDALFD